MRKNQRGFGLLWILLIILLLALLGFAGWRVYDSRNKEAESKNLPAPAKSADETPAKPTPEKAPADEVDNSQALADLKENISAAIESGNTAALEGYMTNPITVVFAASEKGGPETPTAAVADLNYLSGAVAPWDFNLSEATLNSYKAGFYSQFFEDGTYVGKSSDDYVVSFKINSDNKIATIFVAASADLLL